MRSPRFLAAAFPLGIGTNYAICERPKLAELP
jgi:hypothetical protein